MRKIRRLLNRWACRILEEAAGARGDYATAHYWLREGNKHRG